MPSSMIDWSKVPPEKPLTVVVSDVPNDKIALAVAASCHPTILKRILRTHKINAFRTIILRQLIKIEGRISVTVAGKASDKLQLWSCILDDQRTLNLPVGFHSCFGATAEVIAHPSELPHCAICGSEFWGGDECHGCIMRSV